MEDIGVIEIVIEELAKVIVRRPLPAELKLSVEILDLNRLHRDELLHGLQLVVCLFL